ncbi:hypothetical protein LDENG_00212290, partial [Lucifuga dentata]
AFPQHSGYVRTGRGPLPVCGLLQGWKDRSRLPLKSSAYSTRILSCVQTGACDVWTYRPTHAPSFRGLVRMRRAHPWKVVTQATRRCGYRGQPACILLQALPPLETDFTPATTKDTTTNLASQQKKENIVL